MEKDYNKQIFFYVLLISSTETLLMTRFAQTWTDWPVTSVTGSVPPQLALPAHSKNVGLSLNFLQVCM